MAVTYEQIRSFMQGYFIGYSEDCQLPERQHVMDKYYAPDIAFDAGFSGKGEGRGMGLHIARETMRQAGGDLTVESSDAFTAFRGVLPKSVKTAEEETP